MALAELINILLVVLILCSIFIWLSLHLYQRQDRSLLKTPPVTDPISTKEYENNKRKLELEKADAQELTGTARGRRKAELKVKEEELFSLLLQNQEEQRAYYRAARERDLAWGEYRDFFHEIGLWGRLISITKEKELQKLRELYLETERAVSAEKNKLTRKYRLKQIEKENESYKKNRTEESFETSLKKATINVSELQESVQQVKATNPEVMATDNETAITPPNLNLEEETDTSFLNAGREAVVLDGKTFTQYNFTELYPDFSHRVYVEEHFSTLETGMELIQEADFSHCYFVAVEFTGRVQFQSCNFTRTDFSAVKIPETESPHRFLNCDFTRSCFNGASLNHIAFYHCRFERTEWGEVKFNKVKFINCSFIDCEIDNLDFSETVMSQDMIEVIDFSNCRNPPKNWKIAEGGGKNTEINIIQPDHVEESKV